MNKKIISTIKILLILCMLLPIIGIGQTKNVLTAQRVFPTIAVYADNSSGPAEFTIVTRYKQGLKEKAQDFRKPFKGIFEGVDGEDSYDDYLDQMGEYVDEV